MPTIPAEIRISVRRADKATRKIELLRLPYASEKYWVRIDGKRSQNLEVTTITEVTKRLREWLCQGAKK